MQNKVIETLKQKYRKDYPRYKGEIITKDDDVTKGSLSLYSENGKLLIKYLYTIDPETKEPVDIKDAEKELHKKILSIALIVCVSFSLLAFLLFIILTMLGV